MSIYVLEECANTYNPNIEAVDVKVLAQITSASSPLEAVQCPGVLYRDITHVRSI